MSAEIDTSAGGRARVRRFLLLVVIIAAALVVALLAAGGSVTPAPPSPGSPLGSGAPAHSPTPAADPAGATPAPSPSLTSSGRYVVELPDDPELTSMRFGGSDMWVAGSGDGLRGVFIGTIDLDPADPSIEAAARRVGEELSAIPGASDAGSPEPVELTSGPAARVVVEVGTSRFVGYVVVIGDEGWRIVVVNYPEAVGLAVANSFAVFPG